MAQGHQYRFVFAHAWQMSCKRQPDRKTTNNGCAHTQSENQEWNPVAWLKQSFWRIAAVFVTYPQKQSFAFTDSAALSRIQQMLTYWSTFDVKTLSFKISGVPSLKLMQALVEAFHFPPDDLEHKWNASLKLHELNPTVSTELQHYIRGPKTFDLFLKFLSQLSISVLEENCPQGVDINHFQASQIIYALNINKIIFFCRDFTPGQRLKHFTCDSYLHDSALRSHQVHDRVS